MFKEGIKKYFGETNNNSVWYGGSEGKQYLPITIGEDKLATASVQSRVGEPSLSEYIGPGIYKLRVRRYTSSGGDTDDDQTPVNVEITLPAVSPIPTPSPKSTPNPTPAPSASLFPTPRATLPPARITPRPAPRNSPSATVENARVLGDVSISSPSVTPSATPQPVSIAVPAGIVIMLAGIGLSGLGGFLAYRQMSRKTA